MSRVLVQISVINFKGGAGLDWNYTPSHKLHPLLGFLPKRWGVVQSMASWACQNKNFIGGGGGAFMQS